MDSVKINENTFLAFGYMGYDFVVPLADVASIGEKTPEGVRSVDYGRPARYYVMSYTESKLLAIGADEVYGLWDIPTTSQYEMPREASTPENEWIFGAAYIAQLDKTAYLLDCHAMAKRLDARDGV